MGGSSLSGRELAHRLVAEGRWRDASDAFAQLDVEGGLDPGELAEFAVVRWMAGAFDESLELYGRSYRAHLGAGDHAAAAVVALSLAWEHEGRGEEGNLGVRQPHLVLDGHGRPPVCVCPRHYKRDTDPWHGGTSRLSCRFLMAIETLTA